MKLSQLAINSVSTRHRDLAEALAAYAAAGFANVEFQLGQVKEYLQSGHTVHDARRLLEAHGLRCIGGFECVLQAFAAPEERTQNHRLLAENARLIAELGGTTLVAGTDGPQQPMSHDEALDRLASTCAEVAAGFADTGVHLCLEFNWSPYVKSLRTAAEIARRSGAANVGVLFDSAHYHCTPTKFSELNAANVALIKHVHVNDMRDVAGELAHPNDDRVLPGQGCLDLKAIFGALEEHSYGGCFSIEMFNRELWALPPAEAAKRMHESLLPLCEAV